MSENPIEVYRTGDPEVVRAFDTFIDKRAEWVRKCNEFCEKHSGTKKRWMNYFLRSEFFIGLVAPDTGELAPGWRIERKRGMMVPNKRTPEGKELFAEMRALDTAPVFKATGMPADARGEENPRTGGVTYHSYHALRHGDEVELRWNCKVPEDRVDSEVWAKIPLSRWHAEREALEGKN